MSSARMWKTLLAVSIGLMVSAGVGHAQYFGQNKVRYDRFHFKVLETEHFDVYYYPEEYQAAETAARMIERWYGRFSHLLDHELSGRQPLILYASHPDFEQTNAISGLLGESTGGVTEALKRRIVLPLAGSLSDTDHVLGHELVHAFQYDMTGGTGMGLPGALNMPLWFIEGMAEYLSLGPVDPHTAMWLRDAAAHDHLPNLRQLADPRFFPYRYGQAFLAFIGGQFGDESLTRLLTSGGREDMRTILGRVLEVEPDSLVDAWHDEVTAAADSIKKVTDDADAFADVMISKKRGGGTLNIAPSLSPDGKKVIFFSEKDLFTINLYLADVATGKVQRTIVKRTRDPHLESLEFIESAGAWDPSGEHIAVATVRKGKAVLAIFDASNGRRRRRIALPGVDQALNPSWSPDGHSIAFAGLSGGVLDLYVCDLDTGQNRRITDDAYTDMQPSWSPDGTRIAFATDRFTTDLETLEIGRLELALVDPKTGELQHIRCFARGKHIDPAWSPDGRSIYFLSDATGITNVYRRDMATDELFRVTNLFTGATGITSLSPALSVAASTGEIAFSVLEDGDYNIYSTNDKSVLRGEPVASSTVTSTLRERERATQLSAADPANSKVESYLGAGNAHLPPKRTYDGHNYHPRFSLTYVAQPSFAVGTNRLGTELGGGIALYWSDMLENHDLLTALQVQSNGSFTDVGGALGYQNNKSRWTWGVGLQRLPYIFDQYAAGFADVGGETAFIEQIRSFHQVINSASVNTQYPISRARRIELEAGFEHSTFDQKIRTIISDAFTGEVLADQTEDVAAPSTLNLYYTSAAFVYDFSFWGITSPILGERYRMEVSPVFGDLNYYSVLFDYRRYVIPFRPLTIAGRALHYGRYGQDAASDLLAPLFIGYETLVRGYDSASFEPGECQATVTDPCPSFNQLFGTRMGVVNVEARVPPLGLLGLGGGYYGFLPLEAAVFFDAGVAWTHDEDASFLGGNRGVMRSYGASFRLGLSSYAVLTFNLVNPIDRPHKGWYWQFSLAPGF